MDFGRHRSGWRSALLPSAVFALAFVLLGWIASHSIAYALVGLVPDVPPHGHYDHVSSHYHGEEHIHGYMSLLKLAGSVGLVLAFGLALRSFFRYGSFGEWLHEGGVSGTRRQVVLATVLPASVFVLIEHLERLAAGTGTTPSARLLIVGVFVQLAVGLLCLSLVRLTFRVAEQVIRSIARRLFVRMAPRAGAALEGVVFARPPCPMAGSKAGRAPPRSSPLLTGLRPLRWRLGRGMQTPNRVRVPRTHSNDPRSLASPRRS